jgi:zinc/manganese transport system substrate-binding protein
LTSVAIQQLVALAKGNSIPIVGVSETEPSGSTYQSWMFAQLYALDKARSSGANERALVGTNPPYFLA